MSAAQRSQRPSTGRPASSRVGGQSLDASTLPSRALSVRRSVGSSPSRTQSRPGTAAGRSGRPGTAGSDHSTSHLPASIRIANMGLSESMAAIQDLDSKLAQDQGAAASAGGAAGADAAPAPPKSAVGGDDGAAEEGQLDPAAEKAYQQARVSSCTAKRRGPARSCPHDEDVILTLRARMTRM